MVVHTNEYFLEIKTIARHISCEKLMWLIHTSTVSLFSISVYVYSLKLNKTKNWPVKMKVDVQLELMSQRFCIELTTNIHIIYHWCCNIIAKKSQFSF